MSAGLPRSITGAVRIAIATSLACTATMATAAGEPPNRPLPVAPASQPVPFNSTVAAPEFAADASKVTMEQRANGERVYHMNGQGMQSVIARIGADGKVEYLCTDEGEQALRNSGAAEKADER